MNNAAKVGIAGVCTALLTLGGFGAYNVVHGLTKSTPTSAPALAQSTEPPSADKAVKLAQAFLDTWAQQHLDGASSDTDAPDTAATRMKDFADSLKLTKLSFDQVAAAGPTTVLAENDATKVTFRATAEVAGGSFSYPGSLAVIQSGGGQASVHWASSVLYPGLKDDQTLTAGQLPPGASTAKVVASDGKTDLSKFPSLTDIVATIRQHGGKGGGGSNGTGVAIVDSAGDAVKTLKVFTTGRAPVIRTTISATLQAAAEQSLKDSHIAGKSAGLVAVDHSNGWIRAVAFTGEQGNLAINGWTAPGSTMKIISAATLIDKAGLTTGSAATCPPSIPVDGRVFTNVDGESNTGANMSQAFQMSCNTAFIKLMDNAWGAHTPTSAYSKQSEEAKQVFGIGSWSIGGGVATKDPQIIPATSRVGMASDTIGQGDIAVSPLVMASVVATVKHGGFKQPIILPGQEQQPAPQQISAGTAQAIRTMMAATARQGTAAPRMAGLSGVGAKTGTAEVAGQATNSWFVAYDSDIAVAAEVIGGGQGVQAAGYAVRDVLLADR